MKISVIIPVYNSELFLSKCLQSVVSQINEKIEVIIVNDASTDNSFSIIESYSKKYKNVKVFNFEKNQGNGIGRNFAIQQALGEYVMFLDSDDWFEANTISVVLEKIETNNYDSIVFGYTQQLTYLSKYRKRSKTLLPCLTENDTDLLRLFLLARKGLYAMPWIYVMKKEMLKKNSVLFSEGIYYEDNIFVAKSIFYTKKIGVIEKSLYNYRIHKNSIVRKVSKKLIDDNFTANCQIKEFLIQKTVFEEYESEFNLRLIIFCIFYSYQDFFKMERKKIDDELIKFMQILRKSKYFSQDYLISIKKYSSEFDPIKEKDHVAFFNTVYNILNAIGMSERIYWFIKSSYRFGYKLRNLVFDF